MHQLKHINYLQDGERVLTASGEWGARPMVELLRGGDRLGGLLARLGGDRRLRGIGDRLRIGLPRTLRGETLAGDLCLRGAGDRLPTGDAPLRRDGVLPRRYGGESARRRREKSHVKRERSGTLAWVAWPGGSAMGKATRPANRGRWRALLLDLARGAAGLEMRSGLGRRRPAFRGGDGD